MMKRIRSLLIPATKKISLLLLVLGFFTPARSQEKIPEPGVVTCFISALKSQKDSAILACIPTTEEFSILVGISVRKNPNERIPPVDSIAYDMEKKAIRNYQRLTDEGTDRGIDWSSIEVTDVFIEDLNPEFGEIEKAHIYITFSSGKQTFIVKLSKCLKMGDNWKIMNRFAFTEPDPEQGK